MEAFERSPFTKVSRHQNREKDHKQIYYDRNIHLTSCFDPNLLFNQKKKSTDISIINFEDNYNFTDFDP